MHNLSFNLYLKRELCLLFVPVPLNTVAALFFSCNEHGNIPCVTSPAGVNKPDLDVRGKEVCASECSCWCDQVGD